VLLASRAHANPDATALVRALDAVPGARLPETLLLAEPPRMPVVARIASASSQREQGFIPVSPGLGVKTATPAELLALGANSGVSVTWAPPRHLLLDQATEWIHAGQYRTSSGESGAGVVIGIVDSGLEAAHPDLRDPADHTRIAWFLDFSRFPAGIHPELEAEYGCAEMGCAIYESDDIDLALGNSVPLDELRDPLGHGTLVASLAAGNGRSAPTPRYLGVAPEATLIGVRITRESGGAVYDADVLLGVRFVFERARELGMPAVVNLSLGSDFGAHDGGSLLEQGLASFIGPEQPGRAVVVAAGNSGVLYRETGSGYPEPLGVHTEVHVPRQTSVRVPILSAPTGKAITRASVYVWIGSRSGDELAVGFERDGTDFVPLVSPGHAQALTDGELTVTVLNRVAEYAQMPLGQQGAVVVMDGNWRSGSVFAVRLEGHGTASLWVQSEGELAPGSGTMGALFPRASVQGTINVPATHPSLIAVGATVNRTSWRDRAGQGVTLDHYGSLDARLLDSVAYFSAAGPNATGALKPDLVAPGAFVVGAMAASADPANNGGQGIFAQTTGCPTSTACLVIDDQHAVLVGTSAAAPLVSGSIALLLAQDASLTQERVRTLLQAGARRPYGTVQSEQQAGVGVLDLFGTSLVLGRERIPGPETLPAASQSWLTFADDYAHPDPEWPLWATLSLRSQAGEPADGFAPERLTVTSAGAVVFAPLTREAPGLWRFSLACPGAHSQEKLEVSIRFDGVPLVERSLPIAVDRSVAMNGWTAQGGCSLGAPRSEPPVALGLGLACWLRARKWRKRARIERQ
jgi:subtilisin family serine protease